MAASRASGVSRILLGFEVNPLRRFLQRKSVCVNSRRNNFFFKHLSLKKEHNETDYEYEVTSNPEEWRYVERLLPMSTVPVPKPKSHYPSGWRPMKDESLNLPYFVERTKNHMLPVYLKIKERGTVKVTKVSKIHGDLWSMYEDLNGYLEKSFGKKIPSYVHEGNNIIYYKGDRVYYVEQWMLEKGF